MSIVTKQIREGENYTFRILAVGERLEDGRLHCPVLEFFAHASTKEPEELARLTALLDMTAERGPIRNTQKFRHITDSDQIYEFKTTGGLRLFCFFDQGHQIICTHGMIKDGQKPPKSEIEKAEKSKKRYLAAQSQGQLLHELEH